MKLDDLLRRADEVLALGQAALQSVHSSDYGDYLAEDRFAAFRSGALSFLSNVFGSTHSYYLDLNERANHPQPGYARVGMGIMSAAREELVGGWLRTTRGLVSAEIFADFLEMADHLVSEHYKDAAAVIAGSSLEEHLRQLAASASIATTYAKGTDVVPKKADTLNADLAGAVVYSKLDQKSITAWLDLRNKAAHGKYTEYDEAQVRLMIEGVRQFIARVPA
jgi:hypothetical protein